GAAIVATWVSAILQTILINRRIAAETPANAAARPSYDFRHWLNISFAVLCISECELMLQNADVLIVSAYSSPSEVGIYFAAAKTMRPSMFVHSPVGSAGANRFAAPTTRSDREGLHICAQEAARWTFWPSLAAALVILALGHPLLW